MGRGNFFLPHNIKKKTKIVILENSYAEFDEEWAEHEGV